MEKSDNELIAEFMDMIPNRKRNAWSDCDDYRVLDGEEYGVWIDINGFQTSWSLLMPVVEKIEKLGFAINYNFYGAEESDFIIRKEVGMDTIYYGRIRGKFIEIDKWYKAVVEFIRWYQKQQNG